MLPTGWTHSPIRARADEPVSWPRMPRPKPAARAIMDQVVRDSLFTGAFDFRDLGNWASVTSLNTLREAFPFPFQFLRLFGLLSAQQVAEIRVAAIFRPTGGGGPNFRVVDGAIGAVVEEEFNHRAMAIESGVV